MTRKMKDSGIEWIGEIPEEWSVRKLNDIAETVTDYVASGSFASLNENVKYLDEPDYAMLIRTADLSENRKKPVYINKHAYEFLSNSNLFGGEIILSNIGSVGNVYLYKPMYKHSSLAPNSIMLRMNGDNRYYYYWFLNPLVNDELKKIGGNAVQLKFNKTQLRQFKVVEPNIKEQEKIANYLDKKCNKIDQTIEKEREVIEKLKEYKQSIITEAVTKGINPNVPMKDSGVEWIGEIPEHWEIKKLKYEFRIKKDIAGKEGFNILSVTQDGIKIKDISRNDGQLARDYSKYQLVDIDDFVMNHMDLLTGFVDCSKYQGVTSPDYRVFYLIDRKRDKNYYKYIFQSCYKNKIFYALGQGVSFLGRWRLQSDKFLNFNIPIPPNNEQKEISDYLDKKCLSIDKLITDKEKVIEKLTEYKKSLIYECVTGKREVQ